MQQTINETGLKVWVTFQQYGFHSYPAADVDVYYLRDTHRHIFKYKVTVSVTHDDREIEFHQLLNFCLNQFSDLGTLQLNYKSCEMLAQDLLGVLQTKYGNRHYEVEVSEDGECGAIVTSSPVIIG